MFSNNTAIKILVKTDTSATESEKNAVLAALSQKLPTDKACKEAEPMVVSVKKASEMLSLCRATIYGMVRSGKLIGFYSSKNKKRISGIVVSSIKEAMNKFQV